LGTVQWNPTLAQKTRKDGAPIGPNRCNQLSLEQSVKLCPFNASSSYNHYSTRGFRSSLTGV
jgi:hypothetical protein